MFNNQEPLQLLIIPLVYSCDLNHVFSGVILQEEIDARHSLALKGSLHFIYYPPHHHGELHLSFLPVPF